VVLGEEAVSHSWALLFVLFSCACGFNESSSGARTTGDRRRKGGVALIY